MSHCGNRYCRATLPAPAKFCPCCGEEVGRGRWLPWMMAAALIAVLLIAGLGVMRRNAMRFDETGSNPMRIEKTVPFPARTGHHQP